MNIKEMYNNLNVKEMYNNFPVEKFKYNSTKFIKNKIVTAALAIIIGAGSSFYGIYRIENKPPKAVFSTADSIIEDIVDNTGEEYFYENKYESSIEEYLNILEKDKDSPIWLMKIAEVYSVKGDIENSESYIYKAKMLQEKNISSNKEASDKDFAKKDAELGNYMTFTELMNKNFSEALTDGETYLQKYPEDKKLQKTMLTVYMANKQNEKAKELINKYPLDKQSAYEVAEHSRMMLLLNDWDGGLAKLKEAWYIDRDEYKVFDVIAQIAAYNKDSLLQKVMELSNKFPEEPAYKMWLAKIYSMTEETAELAKTYLDGVGGQDVGEIEKVLIKASILQHTEQVEQANSLISTLISEKEDDYRVLHTAGWFYLQNKEYDKALEYCKKSIILNKNYPDNYGFLMPDILKAMGKSFEGEPYFRTALFKEPYNYNIMLTLANFYWDTTKNSEKALEYFKFAEIVKPDDPEIKYNMALINLANEKMEEAIAFLNSAIEINGATPKYHRTLGTIKMLQGKYDEGIKEIRTAYGADQEDILTLNNAGCYYITVEGYLERGEYNLRKAYEGINSSTDEYSKKTITENYEKVKKLIDDYNNSNGGELKVPELVLFY
jgi:Tfp pilus assembly protein PilF